MFSYFGVQFQSGCFFLCLFHLESSGQGCYELLARDVILYHNDGADPTRSGEI